MMAYSGARMQNLLWNHVRSRHLSFASQLSFSALWGLLLEERGADRLTLGLYWPFAAVAAARMKSRRCRSPPTAGRAFPRHAGDRARRHRRGRRRPVGIDVAFLSARLAAPVAHFDGRSAAARSVSLVLVQAPGRPAPAHSRQQQRPAHRRACGRPPGLARTPAPRPRLLHLPTAASCTATRAPPGTGGRCSARAVGHGSSGCSRAGAPPPWRCWPVRWRSG